MVLRPELERELDQLSAEHLAAVSVQPLVPAFQTGFGAGLNWLDNLCNSSRSYVCKPLVCNVMYLRC